MTSAHHHQTPLQVEGPAGTRRQEGRASSPRPTPAQFSFTFLLLLVKFKSSWTDSIGWKGGTWASQVPEMNKNLEELVFLLEAAGWMLRGEDVLHVGIWEILWFLDS